VAKLVYSVIASLDGYVADEHDNFEWAAPDDEVHAFVNDLERPIGTYLYGRRIYDVMAVWETMPVAADEPGVTHDFAEIWRGADKVVYSTTLEAASTPKTRIERDFDPEAVRHMKATAQRDISVGGPHLASRAMEAGWSTSCICSSCPSSWAAAIDLCPTTSTYSSSCSTFVAFAAVSFTFTTA